MSTNNQEFSRYTVIDSQPMTETGVVAKKFMATVFMWMFIALGISTLMAFLFSSQPAYRDMLYSINEQGRMGMTGLGMVITFVPFVFVLVMSFAFRRLSAPLLTLFLLLFAASMGMSLSILLLVYTAGSVLSCFGAAAGMFGTMAVLGYTTKQDLTSFGRILFMGLIGIVIASFINMWIGSPAINYLISIIGVAVFTGLTAYDVQKLKRIGAGVEYEGTSVNDTNKLAIMGALNLYLDFINLFIMLLRLFGNRRD
jgi:FtsH-binding integral membrane protein